LEKEEKKDYRKAKLLYVSWCVIVMVLYLLNKNIERSAGILLYWGVYLSHLIVLKRLYRVDIVLLMTVITIYIFSDVAYLYIPFNILLGLSFLLLGLYNALKETNIRGKWMQIGALLLILPVVMVTHFYIREAQLIKDPDLKKQIRTTLEDGWDVQEITPENLEKLRRLSLMPRDEVYELEGIEYLKNLESLSIWEVERIEGLYRLASLPKLRRLYIRGERIKDLSMLEKLDKLEDLTVGFGEVDSNVQIKNMNRLKNLTIEGSYLENLALIEELAEVEQVRFYNCHVKSMKGIEKLKSLKTLEIDSCTIEDLDKTIELESLEAVDVRNSDVNNVEAFRQMSNVKKLIIGPKPTKIQ
jgi:hypothetical protein